MLMSCPECSTRLLFGDEIPKQPVLHKCSGHGGMLLPMVKDGTKATITLVEREDYVGREQVQMHEGRPIMAAKVTRDDGEDCVVFAPVARGGGS
jgi:hypothetical protein